MGKDLSPMGEVEYQNANSFLNNNNSSRKVPAWLNVNMNMRTSLSENMKKVTDRLTFKSSSGNYSAAASTQQSQQPFSSSTGNNFDSNSSGSSNNGVMDDPLAALLGPMVDATAGAMSAMQSTMAGFPYLTLGDDNTGGAKTSNLSELQQQEQQYQQQYGQSNARTPKPMSQAQGLTPVNMPTTAHKGAATAGRGNNNDQGIGGYWSGGVDMNNIGVGGVDRSDQFGYTSNGDTGVIAMYERLRQVCSEVGHRLVNLAQSLPEAVGASEDAADSATTEAVSTPDKNASSKLLALSSVLEGSLSVEDFDRQFGDGPTTEKSTSNSSEGSVAVTLFAEKVDEGSAEVPSHADIDHKDSTITTSPDSDDSAVASSKSLAALLGLEVPSDNTSGKGIVTREDESSARPVSTGLFDTPSPVSNASSVLSAPKTASSTFSNSSPQVNSSSGFASKNKDFGAGITTTSTRQGFASDRPAVANRSLLDSLIDSPAAKSTDSGNNFSLTSFGEEKQKTKAKDVSSIFL
jgi:hypothetical protein